MDATAAHAYCINHRGEIEASQICGCFYCLEAFPPIEIKEWVDRGATALCPRCGIDAVIGSASGLLLSSNFLDQMHVRWFKQ